MIPFLTTKLSTMGRYYTFLFLILFGGTMVQGQILDTITFQPDAEQGKDADIRNASDLIDVNHGDGIWFRSETWTRDSETNSIRGLISFPIKDLVDDRDTIQSVILTLYKDLDYPWSEGGSHGDNASRLYLITEDWAEDSVTFRTRPAIDSSVYVDIETNNDYDSIQIDITTMVQSLLYKQEPFYGLMLQNTVEKIFKSLNFLSSDAEDATRRPKILILVSPSQTTALLDKKINAESLRVYPNPAIEFIQIELEDLTLNNDASLNVFEATGALILQRNVRRDMGTIRLSTHEWMPGNYYVMLRQGDRYWRATVQLQR